MNKIEFLAAVSARLHGLSREEVDERIGFLSEMLDDRAEEAGGMDAALAAVGTPERVAAAILADSPIGTVQKGGGNTGKRRFTWRTVLLAATSPLWASLVFAAAVTVFVLLATLLALAVGFGLAAAPCYLIYKAARLAATWLYVGTVSAARRILALLAVR